MDKLEELYFIATNSSCFEEAYKRRVCDLLGDVDFQEGSSVDLLLLALTVIQKLYQNLQRVQCPYSGIIIDGLAVNVSLVDSLLKCLNHTNQHVVFTATKAIVLVLQMLPKQMIKVEWIGALFDFNGKEMDQPWRKLYTMEILRKVLKYSRSTQKRLNDSQQQEKNHVSHCQHKEDVICNTVLNKKLSELFLKTFNLEHILFYYIPLIVRPNGIYSFMKSCRHIGTAEDFVVLQASLKLGDAIHDQENVKHDIISGNKENNFIAFLGCIMEIAKYFQHNGTCKGDTNSKFSNQEDSDFFSWHRSNHGISLRGETCSEIRTEEMLMEMQIKDLTITQLCTVLATLIQYLHYPRLPSLIFKKILEVLNQVLIVPSSSLLDHKTKFASIEKIQRSSSICFLSVVQCCLLDKIPKCSGFVGFCGTKIEHSSGLTSLIDYECTDVIALRTASLVLVKSSFILMKSSTKHKGSSLFQKLSLSCVTQWCTHLLSLTPDKLANNKITKHSSNQSEFHSLLVTLFVDQDDDLVEVLLLLLLLHQEILRSVPCGEISSNILLQLDPHLLFVAFVQSIKFDHSVLLDLLISSETRFLEYILQYLHLVVGNWNSFIQSLETCKEKRPCSTEETTGKELSIESLSEFGSVSDFSVKSTELLKGSESFLHELHPREIELFLSKQKKESVEEGIVWEDREVGERLSSDVVLDSSCFNQLSEQSCQNPEKMGGTFCLDLSEVMYTSALCQHPNCDALGKDEVRSEESGLKSIVMAYSSSDESDMENEEEDENANATSSDNQTARIHCNNTQCIGTNKSEIYPFPTNVAKERENVDASFTDTSCLSCGTNNAVTKERASSQNPTKLLHSRNESTVFTAYDCQKDFSAVYVPEILDKIMSMLIRLRMSVARLSSGGHFPYSAAPLITLMENAEKCYDGC